MNSELTNTGNITGVAYGWVSPVKSHGETKLDFKVTGAKNICFYLSYWRTNNLSNAAVSNTMRCTNSYAINIEQFISCVKINADTTSDLGERSSILPSINCDC